MPFTSNYINLPESAITRHAGVEFAVDGDHHYVRCEDAWYRIAKADYDMILARREAAPKCTLSVRRNSDSWLTLYFWDGRMMRTEVPIICLIDPENWSMTDEVTFPDFNPERLVAQDPEPELNHPFAFVDAKGSKGYFIRAHGEGETVWVRISKEHWDKAMRLFHSNHDDDPEGEFYGYMTIGGVVANDEYRCVFVDVNPMGERGEIEFYLRDLAVAQEAA